MISAFPLHLTLESAYLLIGVWACVCFLMMLFGSATYLVCALLMAGVTQNLLIALFGQIVFTFVDDIPAAMLIIFGTVSAVRRWTTRERRAVIALLVVVAVIALATARSDSVADGVNQARQVLIPVGLLFSGYILHDRIRWWVPLKWAAALGFLVAGWVIVEGLTQVPLIHPTASVQLRMGDRPLSLREGLPSAYFADGIESDGATFRPGGPFMNPPMVGFFLGLATFAYSRYRSPIMRWIGFVGVAVALVETFARAGILIAVSVTLAYWSWRALGRIVTVVGLATAAIVLFSEVAVQGNTASHSEGLVNGLIHGVITIIGDGFGGYGFQASSDAGADTIGESLFGLYFTWMGIPMILLVGWLFIRLGRSLLATEGKQNQLVWFAVAFCVAAALSETASALTATGLSWMLVGMALSTELRNPRIVVDESLSARAGAR